MNLLTPGVLNVPLNEHITQNCRKKQSEVSAFLLIRYSKYSAILSEILPLVNYTFFRGTINSLRFSIFWILNVMALGVDEAIFQLITRPRPKLREENRIQ